MKKLMRKIEAFGYLTGQAFIGIFRNGALSFAGVAVLIACLLITGSFFLIIQNISYNFSDMEHLNQIVVYINENCPDDEVTDIYNKIGALENVKAHQLITKEEALEEEKALHPEYFEALDENDNPYRDSIIVTYEDGEAIEELEEQIRKISDVDSVISRAEIGNTVTSLKKILTAVSVGFFLALAIVTVFIIITTIKVSLFSRKDEIQLMDSIGATRRFIVTPFIMEGFIMGVAASIPAFFLQGLIYGALESLAVNNTVVSIMPFGDVAPAVFFGFLVVGVLTGVLGSVLSLRKHLKYQY